MLVTSVSEVFGFPVGNSHGKPANLAGVPRRQAGAAGRMPRRWTVLCSDTMLPGTQRDGKRRRGVSECPQGMPEAKRSIMELSKQTAASGCRRPVCLALHVCCGCKRDLAGPRSIPWGAGMMCRCPLLVSPQTARLRKQSGLQGRVVHCPPGGAASPVGEESNQSGAGEPVCLD